MMTEGEKSVFVCVRVCVCMCVFVCVCARACVCVYEREREREKNSTQSPQIYVKVINHMLFYLKINDSNCCKNRQNIPFIHVGVIRVSITPIFVFFFSLFF